MWAKWSSTKQVENTWLFICTLSTFLAYSAHINWKLFHVLISFGLCFSFSAPSAWLERVWCAPRSNSFFCFRKFPVENGSSVLHCEMLKFDANVFSKCNTVSLTTRAQGRCINKLISWLKISTFFGMTTPLFTNSCFWQILQALRAEWSECSIS